jgi:hypothetical protein
MLIVNFLHVALQLRADSTVWYGYVLAAMPMFLERILASGVFTSWRDALKKSGATRIVSATGGHLFQGLENILSPIRQIR